jgi:hypothetical protein
MRNESSEYDRSQKTGVMSTCLAAIALCLITASADAQTCPFDDGHSVLTREGLVLTRYALGLRGNVLVNGTDFAATDASTVEGTIVCPSCGLDINGNGGFDVVDATIISRKLAGLTGNALTDGLALGSGSRNTPAAVNSFLLAGCGTTGGTVTSITAGTGLSGGTITTTGTIGIAPGGVGNAELAANSVTSSKIAANAVGSSEIADASITQSKLAEATQPQAGYFLSSTGANPGGSLTWVPPPAPVSLSCVDAPSDSATIAGGTQGCATSTCSSGYTVTGGGPTSGGASTFSLFQYINARSGNGWRVCYLVGGTASVSITFSVVARCCKVD